MASRVSWSPEVEIFMTKQHALWAEWERVDSEHGSSTKHVIPFTRPTVREMAIQKESGPSGHGIRMEDIETEDLGSVKPRGTSEAEANVEVSSASHPGEGILVSNPRSKVVVDELRKIRYLYKIPKSVEIRAPKAHEMVNWVVPN